MRRPLTSLHHVGLREYGEPPTHAVDSLDTLRNYIGPQDEPQQVVAKAPIDWRVRADMERLTFARGNFVRFASVLKALDVPACSSESVLRDELLAVLAARGYQVNG